MTTQDDDNALLKPWEAAVALLLQIVEHQAAVLLVEKLKQDESPELSFTETKAIIQLASSDILEKVYGQEELTADDRKINDLFRKNWELSSNALFQIFDLHAAANLVEKAKEDEPLVLTIKEIKDLLLMAASDVSESLSR